ncbi:MAG: FHA domain-containing protein [Acaryochloris sp. RU_4_1]|nr:FHA domain-containing protein [Acaryochloris sp. RU_4_1]
MSIVSAQLHVITDGEETNREFRLTQAPFKIGSALDNSLVLPDPSVLAHHAEIVWQTDHYSIALLVNAARVTVNGDAVYVEETPLHPGDEIRIGSTAIYFRDPLGTAVVQVESPLPGTVVSQIQCDRVLQVTTAKWTQDFPLCQDTLILGRHPQCDIVIDLPVVSQRHARLSWGKGTYTITDLDSRNGLTFAGETLHQKALQDGDFLSIRDEVTLTYQVIPQTDVIEQVETLVLRDRSRLTLGRDPRNTTVIDHPVVSRFHAQIDLKGGTWFIEDLHSSNGTYVNGRQIRTQQPLRPGDTIRIGPYHFVFNFDETLIQQNESGKLRLDAVHLSKVASKQTILLHDISLSILPQEFVAIVGVSGAGKSTLLDALNGLRPATSGSVLVNEQDLYKNFNLYRTELGYVPQDDIIHRELTVNQALDYAARLRLPADVTRAERQQQIQTVLQDLELRQREHLRVGALSGGQRKRVSIGVELLTKPSLFFLDEATSGLDPGTETLMMRLLRRLADQGRTILLITHATKNVMVCDLVVFLAKGGRIAYFGPPAKALTYFGVEDFDEIYLKLEGEQTPADWEQHYRQSDLYQTYICDRQASLSVSVTPTKKAKSKPPQPRSTAISGWRQFAILAQRNWTILRQDRASLILMLALAPILGLLDFVMWQRPMFDPTQGDPGQVFTLLFIAVLTAVMVGSLAMMREIVKEREIYRRERMIGLKILPYVFSKVWLSILLALYQSAIFLLTKALAVNFPVDWNSLLGMYITLFLATLGGMVMGLFVSALAPTQSVAPLLTILFLLPQITFSGAIISLDSLGTTGQFLSQLTVTRWSYESLITLSGVGRDIAKDSCWQLPTEQREKLSESQKEKCQCLGPQMFKRCSFPGLLQEYDPAVDRPQPIKPAEPGDPPKLTPQNQSDYGQLIEDYNDKVNAYRQNLDTWQDQFTDWREKRGTALASAELLVERFHEKAGMAFAINVGKYWLKLGLIMLAMLGVVVFIQHRRDVI